MAMSFTEVSSMINLHRLMIPVLASLALGACTQSSLRLQPDFGNAVAQDAVAQIADPDAQYRGTPAPGSDGSRVGLAQTRYQQNTVIQPSSVTASGSASIGRADNGGGAPAAGASAGAGR